MIDEGIKRAVMLAIVVVVVGKIASSSYDWLTGAADEEAIATQLAMESAREAQLREQRQAENAERRAARCFNLQETKRCAEPRDFREVGACLSDLRLSGCSAMPRINLCAAVEELQECGDTFADQRANGCDRLRRTAMCDKLPAPEDREGLWTISMHDGLWDGKE